MKGGPIRFLGAVTLLWMGARAIALWPDALRLPDLSFATPLPEARAAAIPLRPVFRVALPPVVRSQLLVALPPPQPVHASVGRPPSRTAAALMTAAGYGGAPALANLRYPRITPGGAGPVWRGTPAMRPQTFSRLTVTGWMIARPGGGSGSLVGGGQLGGSQAGVRASYAINASRTLSIAGRLSSPLGTAGGREAAFGIDWQPSIAVPIKLMLEQRVALDRGARTAPALGLAGGLGGVPLPADFRLDAYAQAGVVGLSRRQGYVDGAVRMERPVWRSGGLGLSLGLGAWGAAQPGVSRLDVGPQAVVRLPTGGSTLRLGVEWRQRIAGNARPGSGPALSLGADF
ncbi:hypothetical protein GGR88_002618 [Sphingomonas jejuensis]|uniref:Haemolysin activator HlyB C-terminal domain-containing protein n=1 Tax=Sphingomonas jejuensis TaxID=904715 RepID=A0ABX0XPC9_9SPHN|nr:hypothetical protein [Sphingomonas jejuensis]NJC35104.1 hypothetical protein [Sphingomonas jejuensis]